MNVGTKSLLFGVHAFWFHPVTVFIAWCKLYGFPNWKETVCIFIHDWGYWGCPNMDGKEGEQHPKLAAHLADKWFDGERGWTYDGTYSALCLFHSRGTAKLCKTAPSKLCWADKLSIKYDPWFLYLPRAILSGEIKEYRKRADEFGEIKYDRTNLEWYRWSHDRMIRKAMNHDTTPPYEGH